MLLASVADIAKREIAQLDPPPFMHADTMPRFPDLGASSSYFESDDATRMDYATVPPRPMMHFDHRKTRAVSVDFPNASPARSDASDESSWLSAVRSLTPMEHEDEAVHTLLQWRSLPSASSPTFVSSTIPRLPPHAASDDKNDKPIAPDDCHVRPRTVSLAEMAEVENCPSIPVLTECLAKYDETRPMKLILRKKFSWKNYPDLEEFLVANREEYLRHSTLNYTMQQKNYNSCLTLRMIKLAAELGYRFDDTEFSFVTIRDRIRCYFKSYVQSMKKRGVVVGYAARRAGLVTEEELAESAHTSGTIYVPKN